MEVNMDKVAKIKELENLLNLAERAHSFSLDEGLEESTQDTAYTEYWDYSQKAAAIIIDLIGVDKNTAMRMAIHKSDKIVSMIQRMAA
jgi:hypothetical protein